MTVKSRDNIKDDVSPVFNSLQTIVLNDIVDSAGNKKDDTKIYFAASPESDTVGDWRQWGDTNGFYIEQCTVAGTTTGGGTWVNKLTVPV